MTEFKVGDRFEVTAERTGCVGKQGKVTRIIDYDYFAVHLDNGMTGALRLDEIKPIVATPLCKRCGEREVISPESSNQSFQRHICGSCNAWLWDGAKGGECNAPGFFEYCESYTGGPWEFDFGEGEQAKEKQTAVCKECGKKVSHKKCLCDDCNNLQPITQHVDCITVQLANGLIVESPRPDPKEGWREVWSKDWLVGENRITVSLFEPFQVDIFSNEHTPHLLHTLDVDKCWLKDMGRILGITVIEGVCKKRSCVLKAKKFERVVEFEKVEYYNPKFPLLVGRK
jgi:hypothetical protein